MVFAYPELLDAETVEQCRELQVALELEGGMFAERVVRGEEGAELEPSHPVTVGNQEFSPVVGRGILAIPSGT